MRNPCLVVGGVAIFVAIAGLALAIPSARDAQAQPAAAIGLDMDPANTPPNNANVVGTIQDCARIDVNGAQDFDEDVVDGLLVDVTAQGVPTYSDNGTPGDTSDDTGGITGYTYTIQYSSANLTVEAVEFSTGAVNMVANNASSSPSPAGDPVPDDNIGNEWTSSVLDLGTGVPEDGDGVLDRLTILAEATAVAGQYPLNLLNTVHLDAQNAAHTPLANLQADIAIGQACQAITTPTPTESPTPSPSPTASPTVAPTATATRTPGPTAAPTSGTTAATGTPKPTIKGGVGGFETGGSPSGNDGMSPFVIGGAALMLTAMTAGGYVVTRRLRRDL